MEGHQREALAPLHKVTLFMTPRQWHDLSQWSASRAPGDQAWMLLEHKIDRENEYARRKSKMFESDLGDATVIYTTAS